MHRQDENNLLNILKNNINKNSKILDIGCGIGNNLEILKHHGYSNIYGVDISLDMVEETREKGFTALSVDDFFNSNMDGFDVLLFSHVLEHIGYPDIVNVLESYFSKAKDGAHIVIIMPLLYDAFFNDIDHIKPYYPNGLMALFSNKTISKQYKSNYLLNIVDIYFRKEELVPYNLKSRYIRSFRNRLFLEVFTIVMKILKRLSFNIISKTTGYIAIFRIAKSK
jgi:2-polyprenyl-3-methyl-5-hydroxy-6-metoxy-1,4-benzoquinol methylase